MSDSSPTIQAEIPGLGKFALQDLTRDKLLLAAPRQDLSGVQVPSLGGIHLLRKLGQGAMGAVYLAFHSRLHKKVAVKVLPFTLADDNPEMVQRFVREARIAAKVESPHLLSVLDVNEDQDLFYIVMEFIPGRSAGDYLEELASRGRFGLDEGDALDLLTAVAQGSAAATPTTRMACIRPRMMNSASARIRSIYPLLSSTSPINGRGCRCRAAGPGSGRA